MQRFKIEFPQKVLFVVEFEIKKEDIDYAGHLGNERLLIFATEAKRNFFLTKGFDDVYLGGHEGTIIASNLIVYKSEAFEGETLLAEIAVKDLTEVSFDLMFRFTEKNSKRLVGYVQAGTIFYDYSQRCISEISEDLLKIFE